MDSVTCHWVCVSAVMDTLEWVAAAKVDLLHYCRTSFNSTANNIAFQHFRTHCIFNCCVRVRFAHARIMEVINALCDCNMFIIGHLHPVLRYYLLLAQQVGLASQTL